MTLKILEGIFDNFERDHSLNVIRKFETKKIWEIGRERVMRDCLVALHFHIFHLRDFNPLCEAVVLELRRTLPSFIPLHLPYFYVLQCPQCFFASEDFNPLCEY